MLRKFLTLTLTVAMATSIVLPNTIVQAKETNIKPTNNILQANKNTDSKLIGNKHIKQLSQEDYYKLVSETSKISIDDAKKLTDKQIKEFETNRNKGKFNPDEIDWGTRKGNYNYVQVYQDINIDDDGYIQIEVGAPAVVYVDGPYCRQFSSVGTAYAKPASSGSYTFDAFFATATISEDKSTISFSSRGNVEVKETYADSVGISLAEIGFTFGKTEGRDKYYRKTVPLSFSESL